jgi:hypothetical protein
MRGDAYLYEGPAAGGSELTPLFGPGSKRDWRRSMIHRYSFGVHVTGCGAIVSACT